MPRWLPKVLVRIRELAVARKVLLTLKARRELASLDIGLDEEDACDILASLTAQESAGRLESAVTGEWMYLFNAAARRHRVLRQGHPPERLRRSLLPRGPR